MVLGSLTIPLTKKQEAPVAPTFSTKEIEGWITEGNSVNSEICALYVGLPKTTKTGCSLDCRTPEEIAEGKKIWVLELNSDNGSKINKKVFWKDDPSIIIIDPREFSIDETTGDWNFDYVKTMAKIKAFLMYLKQNYKRLNTKIIVLDGIDVLLSEICENQLRMEKNLDAAGGVTMSFWKIRNKYFYDIVNMLFTIDCDKYLITHLKEDFDSKKLIYSVQKDLPDKLHQIVEFRKDEKTNKFYAKVVADRRDRPDLLGKEFCTMETDPMTGKRIWHGFKL